MEQMPINLPLVPTFGDVSKGLKTNIDMNTGYGNVIETIKRAGSQPGITATALPAIQQLLGYAPQAMAPYLADIEKGAAASEARAQSSAMRRGLTGSDIEAQAMGEARGQGMRAKEQLYADVYSQTSNQMAQMIFQAASGDLQQNRDLILTLAQAMGQELTSQRAMYMFQQALKASIEQAERSRRSAKRGGIGGAIGSVAGAGAGAYLGSFAGPGGTMAGAQMGMGAGQSAGSLFGG